MNSLNDRIDRVSSHITGLTAGRKLIFGLLAVGVIAGGLWWSRLPVAVAMEPVLDRALEEQQLAQVTKYLSGHGIAFRTDKGKVLVPADRKMQVLADLLYEDLLPSDTESSFDAIIKQASIWDSPAKLDRMYLRAKEATLMNVIGRFPGVRKATVLIDPTSEEHINGSVTPSALVDIQTRGGVKNTRQLAMAAVNAVTGAQSNLARDKVQVTIDGAPYQLGEEPADAAAAEMLDMVQQREQMYVGKVRQQLAFIPDALVSVSLNLPQANVVSARATTQESVAPQPEQTLPVLTASVAIPRSYFVKLYQRSNPKTSDPADGLLQLVIDS